jgi:hypothetical protein
MQKRVIIVGAGASFPYGLPLAGDMLHKACKRILDLDDRRKVLLHTGFPPRLHDIARGDEWNLALLKSMTDPLSIQTVAQSFREHLVQQNLDDFVRDHPALTSVVSTLITTTLMLSMYRKDSDDSAWVLRPELQKAKLPPAEDWMRLFVGIARPNSSAENKLSIISFNYDSLLERSMRMYWSGSERKHVAIDDAVEFIYPHGRFSDLPERISSIEQFLNKQASQLRLGDSRDDVARSRAGQLVSEADKIFSVGFSFSADNIALLGLDVSSIRDRLFAQNYSLKDHRLTRLLLSWGVLFSEQGDMNAIVQNGFFEQ